MLLKCLSYHPEAGYLVLQDECLMELHRTHQSQRGQFSGTKLFEFKVSCLNMGKGTFNPSLWGKLTTDLIWSDGPPQSRFPLPFRFSRRITTSVMFSFLWS